MSTAPVNLFVYGSLKNPDAFRAVTGWTHRAGGENAEKTLSAVPARLDDFELVSPDDLYFYAVEQAGRQVQGTLLLDVPGEVMAVLADYEGPHYQRRGVVVQTAGGPAAAEMFANRPGRLRVTLPEWSPGDRRRNLKVEFAAQARIDRCLAADPVNLRVAREVRGATVHELVGAHLRAPGLSEFFIRQALAGSTPDFQSLRGAPDAALFADRYIPLLVHQVVLNQFERRLFEQFRFEIEQVRRSDRYYARGVSLLAALRMASGLGSVLATVANDALHDLDYRRNDFLDYVNWAILAADHLFEPAAAGEALNWIAAHRTGGLLPLSATLELSNLPHGSGAAGAAGFDSAFDSFRFFRQFGLNVVAWRVGGKVQPIPGLPGLDDPAGKRGALVLAPGHPEPISPDPWLVSQLIRHLARFYDIRPHGLAITLHLPRRMADPPRTGRATLPESIIRCLLAVSDDLCENASGENASGTPSTLTRPKIRRIADGQIAALVPTRGLDLLRLTRPIGCTFGSPGPESPLAGRERHSLAEYRFLGLSGQVDYQPIILALKGVQLHFRPGTMLTHKQMQADPELERMFNSLLEWADRPAPIEPAELTGFLDAVVAGLNAERHGRPAHPPATIASAAAELEHRIERFNMSVSI